MTRNIEPIEVWLCTDCHFAANHMGDTESVVSVDYTHNACMGGTSCPYDEDGDGDECVSGCDYIEVDNASCDNDEGCANPYMDGARYRYAYWG